MVTNRANLVLDTPSLSASSSGVLGAKSICTFFGIVVPQMNYTPGGSFSGPLFRRHYNNKGGSWPPFRNFPKQSA
jgi:hypothetical protein